jgi:hypothetical protein
MTKRSPNEIKIVYTQLRAAAVANGRSLGEEIDARIEASLRDDYLETLIERTFAKLSPSAIAEFEEAFEGAPYSRHAPRRTLRREPTQEEIDGVAAVFAKLADDPTAQSSAYITAKMLKRVFRPLR